MDKREIRSVEARGELYAIVTRLMGEAFTLHASAARTTGASGTGVPGFGRFRRLIVLLDVTVANTGSGDKLDAYVDGSLDNGTWFNLVHFTQVLGGAGAKKLVAVLDPSSPGTSVFDVSSDASAGVQRPALFAPYLRARWAVTDGGTGVQSFTFSVTGYGQ